MCDQCSQCSLGKGNHSLSAKTVFGGGVDSGRRVETYSHCHLALAAARTMAGMQALWCCYLVSFSSFSYICSESVLVSPLIPGGSV